MHSGDFALRNHIAEGNHRLFSFEKETVPKHDLGLKIVRGIVDRYTGSIDSEFTEDHYRIRILIPLD